MGRKMEDLLGIPDGFQKTKLYYFNLIKMSVKYI